MKKAGLSLRDGGCGFPLATINVAPGYFRKKNKRRNIALKEIPSCLIPCLLVVFTQQLEILVTSLRKAYMLNASIK